MIKEKNLLDKGFFQTHNFWGDDRLIPYEVFRRGGHLQCIYCGAPADTREHCPSRAFLKEPRPCNLPVLPSCSKCNNSYSADELYLKYFIVFMKAAWTGDKPEIKEKLKTHLEVIKARNKVSEILKTGLIPFDKKICSVLEKLAKGHCVYELTEYYYEYQWTLKEIRYFFRSHVTEEKWSPIGLVECIPDRVLPEFGSRFYRNLIVVDTEAKGSGDNDEHLANQSFLLWNSVQPDYYEYVAYINRNNEMVVKIIIMDFLYAEVTFGEGG